MHSQTNTIYVTHQPMTANEVLDKAADILACKYVQKDAFTSSEATRDFLRFKLGNNDREVFAVMLLDNQHQLIDYRELFFGTIDAAAVYPREIAKVALLENAAAVILAHNHPSGICEPSIADKNITNRLKEALALIDVRVLDHVIVGESTYSFTEHGLL
ncbi:MAG: DNA repair protein RadC [Alteromonadaceae bacterium]|nr:DNA repair protein RadC [Alteromonadaceae bacterium]